MPGIVGIISKRERDINERDLDAMMDCMMHEPFYNSGAYINDQLGIYVGWICHHNSFADCMPIFNEKKDLVLIFSGENFADRELIERLKRQDHEFDTSNASALIHLYEEDGEDFLKRLNGWFNGVLIDGRLDKAILFNDRYGMQRIYYHENKYEFLFSSEAKALLNIRLVLRKIDFKSLGEFLSCGCVLQNRTLFSDISLLPGGAAWSFQNGKCSKKEHYFEPTMWENQPILEKELFYEKLKETFLTILPKYFYPTQPIAMSLTGGLDTRMIMACIEQPANSLPCYTFGGIYRDSLDVVISRKVANACHQQHHVIKLGTEFLDDFAKYAEKSVYISDGYLDACGSYELYLNKYARDIAPIRMTGNFGSEVLRSVRAFKAVPPCNGLLDPQFNIYIREAVETFSEISKGHRLSFTLFKQGPWSYYGRLAVEQSQLTMRTPYLDNDLVGLVYQAPEEATSTVELQLRLIGDCNPALSWIPTDRGFGGRYRSVSIFSRRYYEFLFKAEYYYNHGMPHWLANLDSALSPLHLEKLFLGRNKFHHFRIWFRRELARYVRDILSDKLTASRPYLNKNFLEKIVSGHMRGDHSYTNEINMVLTAELLHRLLIENN
ncbi:MAG: hypothetical protein ACLQBC_11700 [Syntrophales bacterium]